MGTLDKGAVQHLDSSSDRRDKGAVEFVASEATDWNTQVRDKMGVSSVVRTSDTVVTITIPSQASIGGTFDIAADIDIQATIPASATSDTSAIVATPTFAVTADVAAGGINVLRRRINGYR